MAQGAQKKKSNAASTFFEALGRGFKEIGVTFIEGDFKTKLSYIIFRTWSDSQGTDTDRSSASAL